MNLVKTYQAVNPEKNEITFRISRMESIYEERGGDVDEPHRHDYYTVLLVKRAKGNHFIDFNQYGLGEYQMHFVSPGQVHQIIEDEQSFGYVLVFSVSFLLQNSIRLEFIDQLNLFRDYGESPPLQLNSSQFEPIESYAQSIFHLYQSQQPMKLISIGAFLKLILIQANNICLLNPEQVKNGSESDLLRTFKALVNEKFATEHSTSYYANRLHITPDHLNRTLKQLIGKTAKEYIQKRITTEAKRLLYFSKLSSKEIGYELGFDEPANFSAFFKKRTGLSPTKFIKEVKKPS